VLDIERFAQHPELTTADAGQHASLNLRYSPSRLLTYSVDAGYTRTQSPSELSALSGGLTFARAIAEDVEVQQKLIRRLTHVVEGILGYTFTDDQLAGGISTRTHRGSVRVERRLSRQGVVGVDYEIRQFLFAADRPLISHAFAMTWAGQISRMVSFALRGGAALTGGGATPEGSASIAYRQYPAEVLIAYTRVQTPIIGITGLVDTQSVTAEIAYSLLSGLRVRVLPGAFATARESAHADVYRLGFEVEQRIARRLALRASYETTTQRGLLLPTVLGQRISRRHMLVSVAVGKATPRVGRGPRAQTGN
jgi:hypothetical protein